MEVSIEVVEQVQGITSRPNFQVGARYYSKLYYIMAYSQYLIMVIMKASRRISGTGRSSTVTEGL